MQTTVKQVNVIEMLIVKVNGYSLSGNSNITLYLVKCLCRISGVTLLPIEWLSLMACFEITSEISQCSLLHMHSV